MAPNSPTMCRHEHLAITSGWLVIRPATQRVRVVVFERFQNEYMSEGAMMHELRQRIG